MEVDAVPQDDNRALEGHRKAVYARGPDGRIVAVASTGWEAEEVVTIQAADALRAQAEAARLQVLAGAASPLIYWMYACRMDPALLAQTSGLWLWRVRRHLRPAPFARLAESTLQRYAAALGITVEQLKRVP